MRMHHATAHKLLHVSHIYVTESHCEACLRQYHTRNKAIRHLKTSENCSPSLRYHSPAGLGHGAEVARGARWYQFEHTRYTFIPGPSGWRLPLVPVGTVLPPALPGYITPEELAALHQDPPDDPALADYASPQAIRQHPSTAQIADITLYLGTFRAILLFCGGRRRPGDVAHFCELRIASVAFQNIKFAICVVDIVHGAQHDISRGATGFWITLIRQGRVVAIGAAPPCETWAIARWADKGWHDRSNPVPLRAEGCFWGRTDLTPREQRQIRTANVLLVYAIAFTTPAIFYGVHMWLEHPDLTQRHFHVGAASIWLIEQLERLIATPVASTHRVRRNHFGGKAIKPTRLVAIRLPALAS